ncbi:hypothetical protein COE80_19335 [Bacillus pseudomycoides]|uniref:hypothetical protein n=1 Tax=Bacillus pseudomycoides TaxID=64104 RepID=UPI000BFE3F9A|nr:hypothetical protein [Bacillus pseudomycoides]PHB23067.1 hypothetical protein COE80_19335 [Bacillus pseudomycoides]PHE37597.1 hypothetical protein COF51_16300 [Bacillus pseudomycoides]
MGFKADVLRVLIASPSDVQKERDEIEQAIFEWNIRYAEEMNVVLLPSRWENDTVPAYGGIDPQQIINEQLVNKCDILIGVFWTKLGTPTTRHSSGTLEEINVFIEQGKEIMLYFVDRDIPRNINFKEIKKVDAYKEKYGEKSLYAYYDMTKIIEHLYKKVVNYRKENEKGIESRDYNELPLSRPEMVRGISLEDLIISDALTNNELLMLGYILDTESRHFGYVWKEKETRDLIKKWEAYNDLMCNLESNYTEVILNFFERGLLEEKEYTRDGNVRVYVMPLPVFNQLRKLPNEIKGRIRRVVSSYVVELPF